ncbi:hypothetical protein, partial [Pseudomonas aeruginosa]|uniref:hypothetical protein n=1 Tax=Pseudomonas aeruginosa TaxID=287 RepID=UPI00403D4506
MALEWADCLQEIAQRRTRFPALRTRKSPSKRGLVGSGFVHEVVLALTWEEDMLPCIAAGVDTVE